MQRGPPAQNRSNRGLAMDPPIRRPEEILPLRPLRRVIAPRIGTVWAVGPADSVLAACRLMTKKNIGFLVVLDHDEMVGVVSERDCMRLVLLTQKAPDATPVAEIMARKVIAADLTQTYADCLRLMHRHAIRHLPVLDDGIPIAVISIRDLLSEAVAHHRRIINQLERERVALFISTA
jgi:signal-transduction protein with cAMP-binding, CBS, and nucleotidyltransferase domain